VDVAEISPEVIAVSERFAAVNQGTLADPRLRLIINDGKNHLLATHQRYDMISANAIHPGVAAGNGALYTVDFYAAARDHLAEGGVVCQWLPIHQLSAEDVRTLVRSFQVVFPHTTIWFTSDFALLIGSPQPLELDLGQLVERLSHPNVAQDLAELDDLAIRGAVDMAGYFLMDEAAVAEYSAGAAVNTDDHPIIEFTAPRSAFLSEQTNLANLQLLHRYAAPGALPIVKTDTEVQAALQLRGTTNEQVMLGQIATYAGQPDAAMQLYQEALSVDPMNVDARYLAKQQLLTAGLAAEAQGDLQGARVAYEQALALAPTDASAWYRLADVADRLGESDAAGYLEQAVALRPDNARWHVELAAIYSREQQPEQALDQLQTAVSLDPEYGEAHVLLAMFYRQLGEAEKAYAALQEALRLQRQMRY
jgi:tetratricopeptide (TPR) repeat protein